LSEVTDILENIRSIADSLAQELSVEKRVQGSKGEFAEVEQQLARAIDLIKEHERRDELIDNLYYSVGSKLNSTFNLDELLGIIVDSLNKLIGFDAGGVFLVNQDNCEIEAEYIVGYNENSFEQVHQKVGEGILGWVIVNGSSVNISDVAEDERYISARPETNSELAVPMINEGRVIGCINLESDRKNAFDAEDIAILETYATQASLAVERARLQQEIWKKKRLEEEVAIARKIQVSLLPHTAPEIEGFVLAGMNEPSSEVGGDYYDFIPLATGGLGLAIADVSGKGIGAALIISGVRAALRGEIRHNLQPHQVIHKVNHFVYESTEMGSFVTAFYGILIGKQFTYVNAGHNPPILIHNDDRLELLESGGLILGFEEEQYYEQGMVTFKAGDSLLFYTDGVTEAMDPGGVEYGLDKLIRTLRETKGMKAQERIKSIHRSVAAFSHGSKEWMDDLTLMLLYCL